MTDSFGFQEALDQEVNLENNPTARVEELKRRVLDENVNGFHIKLLLYR